MFNSVESAVRWLKQQYCRHTVFGQGSRGFEKDYARAHLALLYSTGDFEHIKSFVDSMYPWYIQTQAAELMVNGGKVADLLKFIEQSRFGTPWAVLHVLKCHPSEARKAASEFSNFEEMLFKLAARTLFHGDQQNITKALDFIKVFGIKLRFAQDTAGESAKSWLTEKGGGLITFEFTVQ